MRSRSRSTSSLLNSTQLVSTDLGRTELLSFGQAYLYASLGLHSGLAEYLLEASTLILRVIAGSKPFYRLEFKIDTYMNVWSK